MLDLWDWTQTKTRPDPGHILVHTSTARGWLARVHALLRGAQTRTWGLGRGPTETPPVIARTVVATPVIAHSFVDVDDTTFFVDHHEPACAELG